MEGGEGRAVSRKGVKAEENVNSGGEQSWISLKSMFLSWTILNYCRDGMERMRNRSKSCSASRRVVMVQHPLKSEGEVRNEGKQDGLAVLIKNGLADDVNSTLGELDTELDYEVSNDEVGGVVLGDDERSEPGNSRECIEIENSNLKLRNEELLRENANLAEEERYLRCEKKTLERATQDLKREMEEVKRQNDHLKQKNTQLMEGMLQLRARLHGAVEVVDEMEVLQDEVHAINAAFLIWTKTI